MKLCFESDGKNNLSCVIASQPWGDGELCMAAFNSALLMVAKVFLDFEKDKDSQSKIATVIKAKTNVVLKNRGACE